MYTTSDHQLAQFVKDTVSSSLQGKGSLQHPGTQTLEYSNIRLPRWAMRMTLGVCSAYVATGTVYCPWEHLGSLEIELRENWEKEIIETHEELVH